MKLILTNVFLFLVFAGANGQKELNSIEGGRISCGDKNGNVLYSCPASEVFGDRRIPSLSEIRLTAGLTGTLSAACAQQIEDAREKYGQSDGSGADERRILNQFCSHKEGWVEYNPGTCDAGGPPPICPVDHWYRDPNSMSKWNQLQQAKYNERLQEAVGIAQSCAAGEKANAAAATASNTPAPGTKTFSGGVNDSNPTDSSKMKGSKSASGAGGNGTSGPDCSSISNTGGNFQLYQDQYVTYQCNLILNNCTQCTGYGVNSYTATLTVNNNSSQTIFVTQMGANFSDVGCSVSSLDCPDGTVNGFTSAIFDYRVGMPPTFCFNCPSIIPLTIYPGGTFSTSWNFSRKCAYNTPPNWGFNYTFDPGAVPPPQNPPQNQNPNNQSKPNNGNATANNSTSNNTHKSAPVPAGYTPKTTTTTTNAPGAIAVKPKPTSYPPGFTPRVHPMPGSAISHTTSGTETRTPEHIRSTDGTMSRPAGTSGTAQDGARAASTHSSALPAGFTPKTHTAPGVAATQTIPASRAESSGSGTSPAGFTPRTSVTASATGTQNANHTSSGTHSSTALPAGFTPRTHTAPGLASTQDASGSRDENSGSKPAGIAPRTNTTHASQNTVHASTTAHNSNTLPAGFTPKTHPEPSVESSSAGAAGAASAPRSSAPAGYSPRTNNTAGASGTGSGSNTNARYAGANSANEATAPRGSYSPASPAYSPPASNNDAQREAQQERQRQYQQEQQREAQQNQQRESQQNQQRANQQEQEREAQQERQREAQQNQQREAQQNQQREAQEERQREAQQNQQREAEERQRQAQEERQREAEERQREEQEQRQREAQEERQREAEERQRQAQEERQREAEERQREQQEQRQREAQEERQREAEERQREAQEYRRPR